jgi:hypothetical protein
MLSAELHMADVETQGEAQKSIVRRLGFSSWRKYYNECTVASVRVEDRRIQIDPMNNLRNDSAEGINGQPTRPISIEATDSEMESVIREVFSHCTIRGVKRV